MDTELTHSKLGISSFILSILCGLGMLVTFIVAGVLETADPGSMDEESATVILIGFAVIGILFTDIVAFGLGIAGAVQKNTKKVFSVLGIIFSATTVLFSLLLMLVGIMAEAG